MVAGLHAAILAFDMATGRKPCERSLLDPDAAGSLQAALHAKLTEAELDHSSTRQEYLDRTAAECAREYQRKAAQQRLADG